MKTSLILCVAGLFGGFSMPSVQAGPSSAFEQALLDGSEDLVLRGQSPGPVLLPPDGSYTVNQQPMIDPNSVLMDPNVNAGVPFNQAYPAPVPYDPWSNGGVGAYPGAGVPSAIGLTGPQPYRFNSWTERLDAFWMAGAGTSDPAIGDFDLWGVDFNKDYPIQIGGSWVLTPSMEYGGRFMEGPQGGLTNSHMPGSMHRFGLGVKLASPMVYGWAIEGSFNPWLATDFGGGPTSDAFMFDGQAAALWQWSPQLMWVMGISYWDRVDGIVLPYGGLVWNPNDFWEFRLTFPKPRVTAFIGAPLGVPTWLYASGEYHVEAYEVNSLAGKQNDLVQMSDWRVMGGLRWETPRLTTFVEAGYIFDRKVKFDKFGGDFKVDSGFMTRVGVRF